MSNGVDLTEENSGGGGGGGSSDIIKSDTDPAVDSNLNLGDIWENTTTGEIYCCIDDTEDDNVWIGQFKKHKICSSTLDVVDIFNDGSGVALYQLDGDSTDTGGNYDGSDTDMSYDSGKFGKDGVFNGSSSKIIMGSWIDTISDAGNLSFSFWQKTTDSDDETIWNTNNLTSANAVLISAQNFQYWDKDKNHYLVDYNSDYNDGNWHHFVCIVDTTNNVFSLYEDNTKIDSKSISSGSGIETSSNMYLGCRSSGDYYFNGSIDQARIFNRALTDDEVNTLYNES